MSESTPPLPVTLIGGFLGAGKTTLVNGLLQRAEGRRLGVLVNDFGDVNVDAELIVGMEGEVLRLSNGCICCSLRDGLTQTLFRLVEQERELDHVLVEASGASDPAALVETLRELQRLGLFRFDGLVTVVDAPSLVGPGTGALDEVAALRRRQIQAADLLVLSKLDLVPGLQHPPRAQLEALHPNARIIEAVQGDVPLDALLGLDPRGEELAPGPHPVFSTFTWAQAGPVPFRPLFDRLADLPPSILRAKGFVHLSERPNQKVILHLAGGRLHAQPAGGWGAAGAQGRLVFIGTFDPPEADRIQTELDALCVQN
jgi:G3E family GTPase